jgi:uncharacterized LabA/DUF88 family protein
MRAERLIAYVDGFNLYYGLREKGWRRYYWLNIEQLVRRLLKENQQLVSTKYFTARISGPQAKQRRQTVFLEALCTLSDFEIFYGHYLSGTISCKRCGRTWSDFEEKMTDVNIATEMLSDAFEDKFHTALLISADSDLVPALRALKRLFPKKRVIVFFPPGRFSAQLKNTADQQLSIGRGTLAKSQFPDRIRKPDGFVLQRPSEWR